MIGGMFPVRRLRPSPPLATFVQCYEERRSRVASALVRPLPARTDQFVEFFLGDLYRIRTTDGTVSTTPPVVAVGLQTRRGVDILLAGELHQFAIKFTPAGFQALFGTPQYLLTDAALATGEVAPEALAALAAPLAAAADMASRVALVEAWLLSRPASRLPEDAIGWAARAMLRGHGRLPLDAVITRTGLSVRQFERRFRVQVGTGPKRFARIARFQRAILLRQHHPELAWTAIAHDAGFGDQAHMNHEFQALCGEAPGSWLTATLPVRETLIGGDVANRQGLRSLSR